MICRAKSLITNKFVYGGFVQGKNAWIVQINSEGSFSHILVDPETVEWLESEKWIPVTERMPDKELWEYQKKYGQNNMEVLVMIEGAKAATTLFFDDEGDFIDENDNAWLVTHWMPMPEPPKEVHHG